MSVKITLDEHYLEVDVNVGDWLSRIVYEPWALSGDLPGPEDVLGRRPELADDRGGLSA